MPYIPMEYTVDLGKTINVTPLHTLFAMGDDNAHRFAFSIVQDGKPVDLSGCTVLATYTNFSPHGVTVNLEAKIDDGKAVALLRKACYTMEGRFALVVRLKNSVGTSSIFYGDGYMSRTTSDTVIDGDYIIYDVNTLLEKIKEINEATSRANTAAETANAAASNANTEAQNANTAANTANASAHTADAAAGKIDAMTVSATPVDTGTATAELTTVDGHYHLALGLPKGDTGATPRISVQVATGAAGSEASVSVSGTAEEPVIHLTIPRGDPGRDGTGTGTVTGVKVAGELHEPDETGVVDLGQITGGADLSDAEPAALGTAAAGTGELAARADHVHPMPTAAQVGAASADEVSALRNDKLDKTAAAVDSDKLGGKAPEYYLQPRNLLDNSDFTRFIAQAGIAGNHGTQAYAGDRWKLISGTVTGNANANGDGYSGIVLNGTIQQILASPPSVATVDIGMVSGSAQITYADGAVEITSDGGTLKWAALYEGSYPVDTLPPYVPKGYGAEMAECYRYYFRWTPTYSASAISFIINWTGTSARAIIYLPSQMYNQGILPTVSFKNLNIVYRSSNTSIAPSAVSVMSESGNVIHLGLNITGGTKGDVGYLLSYDTIDSYIELSKDL